MFGTDNPLGADNQQERLGAFVDIPPEMGWYISGFTDGEGSFNISFKRETAYGLGWKIACSFNISQKDESVLALIQRTLGCGTIRFRKDGVGYYEVRSLEPLRLVIVPFFRAFPLKTKKRIDFERFATILDLVSQGSHREVAGMQRILALREPMNQGGKRKFSSGYILQQMRHESSETTRQTQALLEMI